MTLFFVITTLYVTIVSLFLVIVTLLQLYKYEYITVCLSLYIHMTSFIFRDTKCNITLPFYCQVFPIIVTLYLAVWL